MSQSRSILRRFFHRRRPGVLALLWLPLLLAPGSARAQKKLTLDDALQLARQNNRDLRAARARVAQAQASVEQAWAALLPNVSAQGKYTHNYKEVSINFAGQNQGLFALADGIKATSGNPVQNGVINTVEEAVAANTPNTGPIVIQKQEQLDAVLSATVPLVVPWAYPALTSAKETRASQEANVAVSVATVAFSTAQAFYAAAGTDELLLARRNAIAVAKKTRDTAQARVDVGTVNKVEVTRAQLALLRAEQAETEAEDGKQQAYRALATMIGLHESFDVVASPPPQTTTGDVGELVKQAMTLRPEFAVYDRTLASLDAQARSASWKWLPTLSAFGNLRAFNYAGFSGDYYSWAIGAQLDWTLYDGGARYSQKHLALAQKQENEAHLDLLRDSITDDLINAGNALKTKRRALDTAARSVDLSTEALDQVRAQYESGTATQLDLLQAQDSLVAAEVALAQARFDLSVSDIALQRAAGTFPANNPVGH